MRHVRDIIYGANDGIVTTFAVVASVVGADLPIRVIVIIGLAALLSDAFSMAASNYLATTSESVSGREGALRGAAATFLAFVASGALPLAPYAVFGDADKALLWAIASTAVALALIGALRGRAAKRAVFASILETMAVGGVAVVVAFLVGRWAAQWTA